MLSDRDDPAVHKEVTRGKEETAVLTIIGNPAHSPGERKNQNELDYGKRNDYTGDGNPSTNPFRGSEKSIGCRWRG